MLEIRKRLPKALGRRRRMERAAVLNALLTSSRRLETGPAEGAVVPATTFAMMLKSVPIVEAKAERTF
jgi:hypothetical protein